MPNFSSQFDMNTDEIPDIDAIEADVTEISSARLKLDDLLNEIVDKNEDCFGTDEESKRSRLATSSSSAPKRPHPLGRPPRKRRKKDFNIEELGDTSRASYVIKLFDRQIDLARFEADCSLYGMTREWMRNKPHAPPAPSRVCSAELYNSVSVPQKDTETQSGEGSSEEAQEYVYELPKPVKHEEACYPRPLPPALKTALVEDIIDTQDDIEELRKDNMLRWRKVRNRWKEHSLRQQRRYMDSLVVLKKIFTTQNT